MTDMFQNLNNLKDTVKGKVPLGRYRDFNAALVGALSYYVEAEYWNRCLEQALETIKESERCKLDNNLHHSKQG